MTTNTFPATPAEVEELIHAMRWGVRCAVDKTECREAANTLRMWIDNDGCVPVAEDADELSDEVDRVILFLG